MRKLFFNLLLFCAFASLFPLGGRAADDVDEEMKLYLGEPQVIAINSPKRIAIGNPSVADVVNITKNDLTVNPKSAGTTTLVIWDDFGEQSYRLKVFTENMLEVKERIDKALQKLNLPDVYSSADEDGGKVVLLGFVKNAADRERIATVLGALKDKTIDLIKLKEEEAVIEIDVQVIELNRGSQDTLGFTWPSSLNLTEVGSPGISEAGTTWGKLFHVVNVTRDAFTLKLDALIKDGKARILSRPRVSCQSGKEAKLVVGGEVPVLSGTVTPGTSGSTSVGATSNGSVEYKEYGIILNVRPLINDSGRVHLNLDVTVSELGDVVSTTYALAYKMTKRTATTELFLDDGQTMAIGGLIKKKSTEELKRVPWLSDIPVLGLFFRQKTSSQGWNSDLAKADDTELFITLTPHVMDQNKALQETKPVISGTPVFTEEDAKDPVTRYAKIIQRKVLENLAYPEAAKEAGFQGKVKLSLKLSAQGDLLDLKVKEPSNYRLLDDNAVSAAQKISPYPPFPPEVNKKEMWVDIPIIYQLE
ncbi:MAG: TonB family protein [Candidatus Omnitrophota bacterium]